MTGPSRAGKLIALASEINDVEADVRSLAFMGQALVQTTLPHSDPGVPFFERTSGSVSLSIIANPRIGLPFGTVPRLLLAWICTEAVKTKSPLLGLGKSQNEFLRKLGMRTDGRDCQRLRAQSLKLFSSMLSITYQSHGRFGLKNMPIADEAFVLWDPHRPDDRMLWESTLKLSSEFFRNVTESPVPIDMRVLHALSKSPLAMDVYSWLVYRIFLPLLNFEWVMMRDAGSLRPGVKGGLRGYGSPAERILDAWNRAIRWPVAGCSGVAHPAMGASAAIVGSSARVRCATL